MTEEEQRKRRDAQAAIMQEGAFAIVFDGAARTIFISPSDFEGADSIHLHALAIADLQEILACYACTCEYLGLDPADQDKMLATIGPGPNSRTLH